MIAPQPAVDWSDWFAARVSRMRASEIRELLKLLERPDVTSFAGGIPDPALFPMDAIRAAFAEILADAQLGTSSLQYSVSEGYGPVRNTIRLNYSLQPEAVITDGVARLGALVSRSS